MSQDDYLMQGKKVRNSLALFAMVATLLNISICGGEEEDFGSFWENVPPIIYECGLKEPWAQVRSATHYMMYTFNPHIYGLDPDEPVIDEETNVAKVVILLPGMGGGPFCFLDWARKYQEAGIHNVYTVNLDQSEENPAPIRTLVDKIEAIAKKCFERGVEFVDISLQGHSLGAIVSSKQIWREELDDPRIHISMMISVAGRLKYIENRFAFFCRDVRPDIEATYAAYVADPQKALLYTIWGDWDELVPRDSVHIQALPDFEHTAAGYGHLGVLYAPSAIHNAAEWTLAWIK